MSGRIVVTGSDGTVAEGGDPQRYDTRPRRAGWSRFTFTFADGGSLVLLDPRRLGRVRLHPDIGALGPDAALVTPMEFRALIMKGTTAVKARLLDQSRIAGVGNLLADEILWQAKVSPLARVDSLSSAQVRRLYGTLKSVLAAAIANGGAHTGDMIAARHSGGTCPRDGAPMAHGTVGGRSTWWCSREQALRPASRARLRPAPATSASPATVSPKRKGEPGAITTAVRDVGKAAGPAAAIRRDRGTPRPP